MALHSANVDQLFADLPALARFAAARDAGFDHVEVLCPYVMSISDIDHALRRHDLRLAGIATPMGDANLGECGFMGVPRRIADFREGFLKAVEYAEALDVGVIHLMAGIAEKPRSDKMLKRNLAWAAYNAPDHILTVGPLSPAKWPGYAIESLHQALDLIDWIGAPNLKLAFNTAFTHHIEADICATWRMYGSRIGHVQLSGAQEENDLFLAMRQDGFDGVISASYPS